ncbi:MAG: nucleotidyltransferase domain-containing protein [Chlorobi bacterium]|nr:nucleotidyltransferase domain-containing protein [Chlorobiota bacterium]
MDKKTNQNIIKFISSVASSYPRFVKAYLFGSFARRLNTPDSDIDIALVFENLIDEEKFDMQVQLLLLASGYDTRIEPHPLSSLDMETDNPFVEEIMKAGIELTLQASEL